MKMRTWALLGMLLVGATSWSEQPQDQEEKLISPRAKLELAELDHQADRAELLESLTLLKRGERDNRLRQERSEESRKQRQSELDSLKRYIDEQRVRFEQQTIALERLRRESGEAPRKSKQAVTKITAQGHKNDPDLDLLRMDLEADRAQLQKMGTVLREAELQKIQGYTTVSLFGGETEEKRDEAVAKYKDKYEEVRADFVKRSKELSERLTESPQHGQR